MTYDCLSLGVDHQGRHDHVGLPVDQLGYEAVPLVVLVRAPSAVLNSHQLVSEAQFFGKLLQQVYAEAGATLVETSVPVSLRHIHPGAQKKGRELGKLCEKKIGAFVRGAIN